jgi:hypothetical protein
MPPSYGPPPVPRIPFTLPAGPAAWEPVPNREFLILMLVYVFVGALVLVGWGIVAEVGSHRLLGALAPRESVPDLETRIAECQQRADLVCQEDAWRG